VHLARCLAIEGAEAGIRVNVVNPDAVIRGSRIWDGDWRKERASTYEAGGAIDPIAAFRESGWRTGKAGVRQAASRAAGIV